MHEVMHIVEAINVGALSVCLLLIACVIPHKLAWLLPKASRWAGSVLFITLGAYVGWIAGLFFGDKLGNANYTWQLVSLRGVSLVAAVWFVVALIRCDGNIYRT